MNAYEHGYKVHEILNTEVFPLLTQRLPPLLAINFSNYLDAFLGYPKCTNIAEQIYFTNSTPLISFEFLKRFKDKCIGYCGSNPADVAAIGQVRAIYQLSPDLHIQVGIGIFTHPEGIQKFLVYNLFAMTNYDLYHQFMKDNNDLIIKSDPVVKTKAGVGFNG